MTTLRSFGMTSAALALALACPNPAARGQNERDERPASTSDVRDAARLFSTEAIRKARADLERLESQTKVATVIETVESIGEEPVQAAAARNAGHLGKEAIYILIDKHDHKIEVAPTRGVSIPVSRARQVTIREAFVPDFKRGEFDQGLARGVQAVASALSGASRESRGAGGATAERPAGSGSALVRRDQIGLTLAGARQILAGAEEKAARMNLKMNIAVVDDGGHLLGFARMDGARPASGYTAMTKATTAATFRQETGPLPRGTASPDVLLNLSLQNAAAASGGKITTLHGGVPVVVDGQVVGAVGVGGGSGEQDAEVARAGIARFLEELNHNPAASDAPRGDGAERGRIAR